MLPVSSPFSVDRRVGEEVRKGEKKKEKELAKEGRRVESGTAGRDRGEKEEKGGGGGKKKKNGKRRRE